MGTPFGWRFAASRLEALGADVELRRRKGATIRTDNGNHVLDARFGAIRSPSKLATEIQAIPGVVGHGLFLSMADIVIVGTAKGVRTLRPKRTT